MRKGNSDVDVNPPGPVHAYVKVGAIGIQYNFMVSSVLVLEHRESPLQEREKVGNGCMETCTYPVSRLPANKRIIFQVPVSDQVAGVILIVCVVPESEPDGLYH